MNSKGLKTISDSLKVYFKALEDNYGDFYLARIPKFWQRTKHINMVYHHFL